MADCALCRRPVPDVAYVGTCCTAPLARLLREAADLAPELDTALARQARFGDPGPRPRNSAPAESVRLGLTAHPASDHADGPANGLPFAEGASIDIGTIRNLVGTWCRVVREDRRLPWETAPAEPTPGPLCADARRVWPTPGCEHPSCQVIRNQPPPRGLAAAMRWLADELDWLRYQQFAAEAVDELDFVARLLIRAVDRPVERVDAGLCLAEVEGGEKCQRRLSTVPGAATTRCPDCGAAHDAAARRGLLLVQARDMRGSAAEVARWLSVLAIPTTESMVRGLAFRHRVLADGAGRYRLGDVEIIRVEQIRQDQHRKVAA